MTKEAIKARELSSLKRRGNFQEVTLAYSEEEALKEAKRCLQCRNPVCISGCPVEIDIKKFIYQITQKDYRGACLTIKEKNNFASICGRVCPAEYQCRKTCVLTKKGEPFASPEAINIHFLERFAGDYGIEHNLQPTVNRIANTLTPDPKPEIPKVAVVGSGPAGLCCAGELARDEIKVVIFESLHKAGGVLRYGIPSFRLPQNILESEIGYLKDLGVEIVTNTIIGRVKFLDELVKEFDAVFLGLGAGVPYFLNIKGENLCNVYSANEFLTRVNLMGAYKFPEFHTPVNIGKKIIVIGGGNTAMDAARVALRLQKINGKKPDVRILYRRSEVEMPARRLEIVHAKEEGLKFEFLVQPIEFKGDSKGWLEKIKFLRCKLGEFDSSGRRKPVTLSGSEFDRDCDMVIIAVGLGANKILTSVTRELEVDKWGDIIVNTTTMETSIKGVFAGGDIVGGEGTVIEAMGMAKKGACSIIKYLSN